MRSTKTPRTPMAGQPIQDQDGAQQAQPAQAGGSYEALLIAMESRLSAGIDQIGSSVESNSDAIRTLRDEISRKESAAATEREENKSRIDGLELEMSRQRSDLQETIARTVRDELQNLSYGQPVLSEASGSLPSSAHAKRFWECRRSLHVWPVPGPNRKESFLLFLKDKMGFDDLFI